MYVCTSRPNLGHSASARTKNKGKDWEEPLLRSSSCGLLMLMAAFQAAICVCVAGKGLGRGDQQGEGCMYVCTSGGTPWKSIHTYVSMYVEPSRKPCLRCQRHACLYDKSGQNRTAAASLDLLNAPELFLVRLLVRVATPNPFSTPFAFSGFSHRPSSRKGAKWH